MKQWSVQVTYQDGTLDSFDIEALWALYDIIHLGIEPKKTDKDIKSILILPKAGI